MLKRLFLDIETCPNVGMFWRTGPKVSIDHKNVLFPARIICAGYKWQHEKKVNTLIWTPSKQQFQESDKQLVTDLMPVISEADELVAHYGDRFDFPWIRGRALKHGLIVPTLKTIDTKAWSSRLFYLPSNKLDFLGSYLGIGNKIRTEYDLWVDVTFRQSSRALAKMVKYLIQDVHLLEGVFHKLSYFGPAKTHVGVFEGKEKWSCAHCGSKHVGHKHRMVSAQGTIKHEMKCKTEGCGKYYMVSDKSYQDFLENG